MPMDFPDLKSIVQASKMWEFRGIKEGESEDDYRIALANFVYHTDPVESEEIRNKVGWDKFSDDQNKAMLRRHGMRGKNE